MRSSSASARFLLLLGVSLAALGAPASAEGPTGGAVAKGKAAISQNGNRTVIRQRSNRAVVNWKGFDVSRDHKVVFDQPGKSSATLNRVNSAKRSVIEGVVRAPGTVIVQNRAGVIFTSTARLDAGGMVAASQDIDAARFQREGRLVIGGGERAGARVVNAGEITVRDAGLAALVGPDVENSGSIVARRGTVALASGARTTVDFAGDGVVNLVVAGDAPGAAKVANRGLIDVGDGRVVLSAGAASSALDAAINTTGVIRAAAAHGAGGEVVLTARGAGEVRVGGRIDVSGAGSGGALTVTGDAIEVARSTRIDASGGVDGGTVRLGGNVRGNGPLRRAERLSFAAGAQIVADGASGRGGEVVLWSDGVTLFDGVIKAGGPVSGGFVETSGAYALNVGGSGGVDVGPGGRWLLDPRDVEIASSGLSPVQPGVTAPPPGSGAYTINRTAITNTLNNGGDVTITTVQPGASMAGDITVSGTLTWTGAGALRLEAERDIKLNASVTTGGGGFTAAAARNVTSSGLVTVAGAGSFTLDAGEKVLVNQNIRATGSGGVSLRARTGDVEITQAPASNVIVSTTTGPLSLAADRGAVRLKRVNASAGVNVQVYSESGPVRVTAGTQILLDGGFQGGRWVRLGSAGSSSDLTLAAPDIKVRGGGVGNTFAEVVAGAGGSITMDADLIRVLNGDGDQGRIQTFDGASLTLRAESQIWNGPVRAGTGASNGGEVIVSGAISAGFQPQFSLARGFGFTFSPEGPAGTASRYDSTQPFVVTTSGTGTIDIDAPVAAQQITLETEERVGLGPAGRLTASGPGDALVISAGRRFRNESDSGAAALGVADPDARWLLYLNAFAGLTGPVPEPRAFDLYGRTYTDTPPPVLGYAGDRIVYAERPTLTITGDSLTKTYGTAAAPGYTVAGLRPGDSLATALEADPTVGSAGAPAAADVGTYATTASATASEQGYLLAFADGALGVTPASLTVTANDADRTYGAANPSLTAGYAGFVLGQSAADLGGALALTTPATAASDVGSYAITASGLTSRNYAISYRPGALRIDPAQLTVTPGGNRTYGAGATAFDTEIAGFVLGQDASVLGGTLVYETPATAASDAGAYALTASGLTSRNYEITYASGALTVDPALLTVTPRGTRTYGSPDGAFDADYAGFVLGQDASVLDGTLAYATPATASSDAGRYALTASGVTSPNYAIAFTSGALDIVPAPLAVTADSKSRTYGAANPTLTASASGFVLGQSVADLGGTLDVATTATQSSDVGAYAITASGLTSGNYAISYTDGALSITPAALIVAADDVSRTYGGAAPALTAELTGFVLGQSAADLGGALTVATSATASSDVGSYLITASGLTSSNYAITYTSGALTIDPARLTVTPGGTRTYGGGTATFDTEIDGFVLGQDASVLGGRLSYATPAAATSDVGAYDLTASGLTSANYDITYATGALEVTAAPLTVTSDAKSRSYGAVNPTLTAGFTGFVLGQSAADLEGTLALDTTATRSSDVGTYAITGSGLTSRNYDISFAPGALRVTPAALTVTADDTSRTYGAANPRLTASGTGFVLGQDLSDLGGTLALATPATRASDAGTYAITGSGLTSRNYDISFAPGALRVTPAALTVAADDTSRTYGAANPRLTASGAGFVLGQGLSDLGGTLALATPATRSSDVGTYAIIGSGLTSANYDISFAPGALRVTPAALTVAADDTSRTYGAANPRLTASGAGFVLGQDLSDLGGTLAIDTTATRSSDVGTYAITASGLTSRNYDISFAPGALRIDPAALTVAADDKSRTYGAANPRLTASGAGFVLGQDLSDLGGTLALATPATRSSDAGTYSITASGLTSRNYDISYAPGALRVDPARLVVTPAGRRTYGSDATALSAEFAGFVLGQDASNLGGSLAYTTPATRTSDAGTYALTASGLTSGNYAISYAQGALAVAPAPLTVRVNDAQRQQGQANPGFSARYEGFVLGQDAGDLDGALAFSTAAGRASPAGEYPIAASGVSSGNYRIIYANGLLSVRPAPGPAPTPTGGPGLADIARSGETFGRGAPPFTPGDSAFRTTNAEVPTSIESTFALTYSLGEIAQLVPPDAADTDGFTPASGGLGEEPGGPGGAAADCSGPIAPATPQAACVLETAQESFWSTTFPGGSF